MMLKAGCYFGVLVMGVMLNLGKKLKPKMVTVITLPKYMGSLIWPIDLRGFMYMEVFQTNI
jgi:hypothetical protein